MALVFMGGGNDVQTRPGEVWRGAGCRGVQDRRNVLSGIAYHEAAAALMKVKAIHPSRMAGAAGPKIVGATKKGRARHFFRPQMIPEGYSQVHDRSINGTKPTYSAPF